MTLIEHIQMAMLGVDSDDSEQLAQLYRSAPPEGRKLLDEAFICLCGWNLQTLLAQGAQ